MVRKTFKTLKVRSANKSHFRKGSTCTNPRSDRSSLFNTLNAVSHSFTVKVSILIARALSCNKLLLFMFTNFLYLIINNGLWWAGRQRDCSDALDEVSQVFSCLQLTVTGESPKNTEDQVAWDVTFNLISLSQKQKQKCYVNLFDWVS